MNDQSVTLAEHSRDIEFLNRVKMSNLLEDVPDCAKPAQLRYHWLVQALIRWDWLINLSAYLEKELGTEDSLSKKPFN